MTKKDLHEKAMAFAFEIKDLAIAATCEYDDFSPETFIGRLHALAESALFNADRVEAEYKAMKEDEELWTKVRSAKGCLDYAEQDDAKLAEIVADLKKIVDVRESRIYEHFATKRALFIALRQPTDVELDYELVDSKKTCFRVDKFGLQYDLMYECDFGASEGIYLDLYLVPADDPKKREKFATIKTLKDGDDAFRKMSALGCEYVLAFKKLPNF